MGWEIVWQQPAGSKKQRCKSGSRGCRGQTTSTSTSCTTCTSQPLVPVCNWNPGYGSCNGNDIIKAEIAQSFAASLLCRVPDGGNRWWVGCDQENSCRHRNNLIYVIPANIITIGYMVEPTIAQIYLPSIIPRCNLTGIGIHQQWRQIIIDCGHDRSKLLMTAVTWA